MVNKKTISVFFNLYQKFHLRFYMLKQNFKIQYLFKHLSLASKQLLIILAPTVYFGSTTYSYAQEMTLKYFEKNLLGNKINSHFKYYDYLT